MQAEQKERSGNMKRLAQWIMSMCEHLFNVCKHANGEKIAEPCKDTAERAANKMADSAGNAELGKLFESIVNDIAQHKSRRFHYRARPVGFKGSDVLFDAEKKFHRGMRIVRSDGRVYEIYKVTKLKPSWMKPMTTTLKEKK